MLVISSSWTYVDKTHKKNIPIYSLKRNFMDTRIQGTNMKEEEWNAYTSFGIPVMPNSVNQYRLDFRKRGTHLVM